VVRIPSLTRRSEPAADTDERRDTADRAVPVRDAPVRDADDTVARGRTAVVERPADTAITEQTVAAPVRARGSGLATFSLIIGVLSAAAVATGVLALPGVAVGLLGVLVAVTGLVATSKPHVAGRFDATLGLLFSLAAVVVGLLALGNAIAWPNTDTNQVASFADWLKAEIPWLDRM
jgi:hypothetical protein